MILAVSITPLFGETTIRVPISLAIPDAPDGPFSCEQDPDLPEFAKILNVIGPESELAIDLTVHEFR